MDCAIGIVGDGFVLVATDTAAVQSIIKMKDDEDKILKLDEYKFMVRAPGGPCSPPLPRRVTGQLALLRSPRPSSCGHFAGPGW